MWNSTMSSRDVNVGERVCFWKAWKALELFQAGSHAWSQQGFLALGPQHMCCFPLFRYKHAALALPELVSCQVVTTEDRSNCVASAKLLPSFVGATAHHRQPCSTLQTCVLCTPGADCLLTAFRKSLPHLQMHFQAGGCCSASGAIAQGLRLAVHPYDFTGCMRTRYKQWSLCRAFRRLSR